MKPKSRKTKPIAISFAVPPNDYQWINGEAILLTEIYDNNPYEEWTNKTEQDIKDIQRAVNRYIKQTTKKYFLFSILHCIIVQYEKWKRFISRKTNIYSIVNSAREHQTRKSYTTSPHKH